MIKEMAMRAKEASKLLPALTESNRQDALKAIAKLLIERKNEIISENIKDLTYAKEQGLSEAMIDRLLLDDQRIMQMAQSCEEIASQPAVLGKLSDSFTRDDGLQIAKQNIPLGVILMIFESRPNVVIDCAALAIKSGNSILLKGGKEAKHSNAILGDIVTKAINTILPVDCVQVIPSDKREYVNELLSLRDEIDVVIPRGGEKLIQFVYDQSKIPVIAHFKGVCHIYIDKEANLDKALAIAINAKTQRPGVCNAMETLIIHQNLLPSFSKKLITAFKEKNTELRVDPVLKEFLPDENLQSASDADYACEFLDNILAIKVVAGIDEAIYHIQQYGSHHTEAIITENEDTAQKFMNSIDASCVVVNASTRFNDGGQLGLGAELGIATTKLHAYGPMGAAEMTTKRFVVRGNGHIRQ
jgi:glutamate-5-semialdehyde dehydrogenase